MAIGVQYFTFVCPKAYETSVRWVLRCWWGSWAHLPKIIRHNCLKKEYILSGKSSFVPNGEGGLHFQILSPASMPLCQSVIRLYTFLPACIYSPAVKIGYVPKLIQWDILKRVFLKTSWFTTDIFLLKQ